MSGINNFTLKIANVNGSGSASANSILAKSIFRMGVPVSAKNIFPSNIQGLPTWYAIRVNGEGHTGGGQDVDYMIAVNPQSMEEDIKGIGDGGYLIYDSTIPLKPAVPDGVNLLPVPLTALTMEILPGISTRMIMRNICYVGVAAAFLNLDMDVLEGLIQETYARKPKLVDMNFQVLKAGYDYAKNHYNLPLLHHVVPLNKTSDKIFISGNTATALGCLYAGATFSAWYPLTPSTSVAEAFMNLCKKYRKDTETGKNNYCIIQAEDEIAAIGMVIGAGWNGARAFTPTSGPGISLMSEFIGLAYYAEIPVVIVDVQRTGPSTGLPTRTQQGDILNVAYASHGDTRHIVLFPADPGECFSMSVQSFDLAERFQTPVIMLTDLDIGMNDWVVPEFEWEDAYSPDRGKIVSVEDLKKSGEEFYRYVDSDQDGICRRSLPGGHPDLAYFTRGTGHDVYGKYSEKGSDYKENVDRLLRKFNSAKTHVPAPEIIYSKLDNREHKPTGLISAGGSHQAILEAIDILEEAGIPLDYMRLRAFPFSEEVEEFLESHKQIFVIEQNRDAQLHSLLLIETRVGKEKMNPLLHYDGTPVTAGFIVEHLNSFITDNLNLKEVVK